MEACFGEMTIPELKLNLRHLSRFHYIYQASITKIMAARESVVQPRTYCVPTDFTHMIILASTTVGICPNNGAS